MAWRPDGPQPIFESPELGRRRPQTFLGAPGGPRVCFLFPLLTVPSKVGQCPPGGPIPSPESEANIFMTVVRDNAGCRQRGVAAQTRCPWSVGALGPFCPPSGLQTLKESRSAS